MLPKQAIELGKARSAEADTTTGAGIDKNELYGEFSAGELISRKGLEWRDRLYRKAAHKSLDIADSDGEEMGDINANKTYNGLQMKDLLTIGGIGLAAMGLWQAPAIVSAWNAATATPDTDTDTSTNIGLGGGVPVDVSTIQIPE